MQTSLNILLAVLMGVMLAVYLPMNSVVARYLNSPIAASIPFFFIALITSILLLFLSGDSATLLNIKNVPSYLFLSGFISAFMILGTTFLIPKIGARRFFIVVLAGQLTMAMVLSHFGFLESPKDPVTMKKLLGASLMFVGAVITTI
jgi:bacterial/archaeal transporter family-2 protein